MGNRINGGGALQEFVLKYSTWSALVTFYCALGSQFLVSDQLSSMFLHKKSS